MLCRQNGESRKLGVFSLKSRSGDVPVETPDGTYENLLGGSVTVRNGRVECEGKPILFTVPKAALA